MPALSTPADRSDKVFILSAHLPSPPAPFSLTQLHAAQHRLQQLLILRVCCQLGHGGTDQQGQQAVDAAALLAQGRQLVNQPGDLRRQEGRGSKRQRVWAGNCAGGQAGRQLGTASFDIKRLVAGKVPVPNPTSQPAPPLSRLAKQQQGPPTPNPQPPTPQTHLCQVLECLVRKLCQVLLAVGQVGQQHHNRVEQGRGGGAAGLGDQHCTAGQGREGGREGRVVGAGLLAWGLRW